MNDNIPMPSRLPKDATDASMVNRMRLVLAMTCLLTLIIDPAGVGRMNDFTIFVFAGYLLHSLVLNLVGSPRLRAHVAYWLDVGWFYLIVLVTGGSNSFFFLFFFFSILTASFTFGFEAGARTTLVSTALFATTAITAHTDAALARVLLRATFLLALGYMIAHWGGLVVSQQRRLALLHEVTQQSNPRFGVDQTIATVLEKVRQFYGASRCILLMRESGAEHWSLRAASGADTARAIQPTRLSVEAATPLLAFSTGRAVLHTRPLDGLLRRRPLSREYLAARQRWVRITPDTANDLAELLDAGALVTVPVPLRTGEGRLIVVTERQELSRQDAQFLLHIVSQVFPVVENIELLDRIASDASQRERERIARDLHDTTVQPYIGLSHGLSAIRKQAGADNPLLPELDNLQAMTTQVIGDLRRYASSFRAGRPGLSEPELLLALRRHASQVKQFYGIDIAIHSQGQLRGNDRLAAEVFQIVSEGISNICKHTTASSGAVMLACGERELEIRIENNCPAEAVTNFRPHSIAERALALGGQARVLPDQQHATVVQITIPI
ncbi:sensor histidine kinase [Rugamonas apoptosis]|uniref:histidine kinase n=1 Tax=Rugamonas apoptosis TaxID=2758570 RepID=A0A7W2IJ53_9BURK|nr:histidine kinase [Rugamonas apoptosis]MBA5686208.1 histidine kinase [Rugamonas apoptosis]